MNALQKLETKNNQNKFICVGLDSDIEKIPTNLLKEKNPIVEFNKRIIEATKDHACAYKINFAFYECRGIPGYKELEETLKLIPSDVLTIGDAKRGDIGNTSRMYAKAVFDIFGFDSITINAYMGEDSISPFLEYSDKLNFILALTSNPGANDFENLRLENGNFLFQEVIKKVIQLNSSDNCGIVFGATKIDELNNNLDMIGNLPVLLPGVGAQGGSLEDVVNAFKLVNRKNYLVNVSRGIIYKDSSNNFDAAANEEIIFLNESVKSILS